MLTVCEKMTFNVFIFGCHGNQDSAWNLFHWAIFIKGPLKFGENWPSGLGKDVISVKS